MTLHPFLEATLILQIHMIAAVPAIVVGPFVLFRRRVDAWHKRLGYVWLTSMMILAVAGLFIPSSFGFLGFFGPLHLFSLLVIYSIISGVGHARRGNIAAHEATFRGLWFGGIGGAGLMQFLPGRAVHEMVFGAPNDAGYIVIAVGGALLAWLIFAWRPRAAHVTGKGVSQTA
jgi:uncharacterized membrane protein